MNKVYIITYAYENTTINIRAYQSESQAKHNFELIKTVAYKFDKLHPSDPEYYDYHSKEENAEVEFAINNFENTLNKEELSLFNLMKDVKFFDGIFKLESVEIEYAN